MIETGMNTQTINNIMIMIMTMTMTMTMTIQHPRTFIITIRISNEKVILSYSSTF